MKSDSQPVVHSSDFDRCCQFHCLSPHDSDTLSLQPVKLTTGMARLPEL